ncbi:MAG: ion transporter [Candidatus Promineifilaceae bacterium]
MTNRNDSADDLMNSSRYELYMLLVSMLALFNFIVVLLPNVDPQIKGVISIITPLITIVFMADFLYRFFTAESKRDYLLHDWGWADLLAAMPVQAMAIFRIFRAIKVVHYMRQFGLRTMLHDLRRDRAGSVLFITIFLVILVLELGSITMLYFESASPEANITTPGDAVWWAIVSVTTVGYGDQYPVTSAGRVVGVLVMVLGLILFGVLTGFLANFFVQRQAEAREEGAVGQATRIGKLEELLAEQERVNETLRKEFEALKAEMERPVDS